MHAHGGNVRGRHPTNNKTSGGARDVGLSVMSTLACVDVGVGGEMLGKGIGTGTGIDIGIAIR